MGFSPFGDGSIRGIEPGVQPENRLRAEISDAIPSTLGSAAIAHMFTERKNRYFLAGNTVRRGKIEDTDQFR